jgi:hypothetical protein
MGGSIGGSFPWKIYCVGGLMQCIGGRIRKVWGGVDKECKNIR